MKFLNFGPSGCCSGAVPLPDRASPEETDVVLPKGIWPTDGRTLVLKMRIISDFVVGKIQEIQQFLGLNVTIGCISSGNDVECLMLTSSAQ